MSVELRALEPLVGEQQAEHQEDAVQAEHDAAELTRHAPAAGGDRHDDDDEHAEEQHDRAQHARAVHVVRLAVDDVVE